MVVDEAEAEAPSDEDRGEGVTTGTRRRSSTQQLALLAEEDDDGVLIMTFFFLWFTIDVVGNQLRRNSHSRAIAVQWSLHPLHPARRGWECSPLPLAAAGWWRSAWTAMAMLACLLRASTRVRILAGFAWLSARVGPAKAFFLPAHHDGVEMFFPPMSPHRIAEIGGRKQGFKRPSVLNLALPAWLRAIPQSKSSKRADSARATADPTKSAGQVKRSSESER